MTKVDYLQLDKEVKEELLSEYVQEHSHIAFDDYLDDVFQCPKCGEYTHNDHAGRPSYLPNPTCYGCQFD